MICYTCTYKDTCYVLSTIYCLLITDFPLNFTHFATTMAAKLKKRAMAEYNSSVVQVRTRSTLVQQC